ncbi:MAG TPA: NAD(P)/FAD-dependent oxidoreductase [Acidimicrobiales bacterium]|nr:NAD(P)/FAD-dependent oxidoreductase [Acidimicrobiales bacterium]
MTTTDPTAAAFDWRSKYAAERDKRIRVDGNDQYQVVTSQLSHGLDDPYLPVAERDPVTDHVTVAVIGAGFAGLLTGARLKEAGVDDVRVVDRSGDFGGTWYWNRYPGAQCDTKSLIYLPLLEETGHMPTEQYVHAPEILEHCQRIAKQYGLYDNALFHTGVTELEWDDERDRWIVRTDRGDAFTAQFVTIGTGPLQVPKLPGIEGISSFGGHSFHTSRWDYGYTGGDPSGAPMTGLADKRVALVGTGATSVQCVPHLAAAAQHLYVFQRTPSSVDVRGNETIDPEWFAEMAEPGWQQRWIDNFVANMTPSEFASEDLVNDGWTDLAKRMRDRLVSSAGEITDMESVMSTFEEVDYQKMSEIRSRVESVVHDPETAHALQAWYRQLCKRPCFHDEYLDAYNQPNVTLVDTDGKGVERVTEHGVVVAGQEYEVDCIIYASGFEVGTGAVRRNGFDMVGVGGRTLSEHWADGMRSMHGIHVHGFPNAFMVQLAQGGTFIANVPTNHLDASRNIAAVVGHAVRSGATRVELTEAAEDDWMGTLNTNPIFWQFLSECTPGYYNNEGHDPGPDGLITGGYPLGPAAYFRYSEAWRNTGIETGDFAGLTIT